MIEAIYQREGKSHLGSGNGVLRKYAVTFSRVCILSKVNKDLGLIDESTILQLQNWYESSIDGKMPRGLLSQIDIAFLVLKILGSECHPHHLYEWAEQMAVKSRQHGVNSRLGSVSLQNVDRLSWILNHSVE